MAGESNGFCIVVLSYNHPGLTSTALKSVRSKGTFPAILVHNGSLPEHREALLKEFSDVDHVILETNRGYSGGANFGISKGFEKAEWVVFLTNDCVLESLPHFPDQPAVLAPQILIRNTGKVDSLKGWFNPAMARLEHQIRLDDGSRSEQWRDYAPGTAFAVHKKIWTQVGGFDESLGTYWEDVDWSQRVRRENFLIASDLEWKVNHGIGKTCRKQKFYTIYLYQRNRALVSWRYAEAGERVRLGMVLLLSWTFLGARLLAKRRFDDLRLLFQAVWHSAGLGSRAALRRFF
ncbi:MAG: glycosyltransferase [Bdellovibrionota bacterium]